MQNVISALSRLNAMLCRISLWLAGAGLVAMTGIVFYFVIKREVFDFSPVWVEPIALLLMSWFIFLGSAVGVYERFHMGFDALTYVLPDSAARWLKLISDLAILAFSVGMIWYGFALLNKAWGSRMPIIGISSGLRYLPLITGGVLIALFALEHVLKNLAGTVDVVPTEPDVEDILSTEA